jgi:hypothetical protein
MMAIYAPTEHMSAPVAFAGSLLLDAFAVGGLCIFLLQRLSAAAYTHHDSEKKTVPVQWAAPDWSAIGDRLQAAGVKPGELNAITAFSRGLNLSTVHQARSLPGPLGRMSLWEVWRSRRLRIIAMTLGLTVGLVWGVFPSVSKTTDRATSWAPVEVLVIAGGLVGIYSFTVMFRRNLTSPRFAIVIPSGWRHHFAGRAAQAAAVLCHEFSHLRHRDALQRRIIATLGHWSSFASVYSAMMAAVLGMARNQDLFIVGLPLMITAAVGGVLATRRARHLFPLAQEVRADAEVLSQGFTAEELRAGLTALHEVARDSTLAMRLRIVTAEAGGPFLSGFGTMVKLLGLTYALPIVALTGMVLA